MLEMPSSIRLMTIVAGRLVVRLRYEMVAMPKVKAIGTPMPTHTATRTTKNTMRLPNPIAIKSGWASHRPPATSPTTASAETKPRRLVVSRRRNSATSEISPAPTSSATTRYPSEISRVMSSVEACTLRYATLGTRSSTAKTITTSSATVASQARTLGAIHSTNVVSRICAPRRTATTAPNIASQRKRKVASSSVHMSGLLKT
jgi:hypothetical protein